MNRAPLSALLTLSMLMASVGAHAQSAHPPVKPVHGAVRVDAVDVPFEVKIEERAAVDTTSIEVGGDHWEARGYDLKSLIAELFQIDARLVDLPEEIAARGARYDVSLSAPVDLDETTVQHALSRALEERFGITVRPEARTMAVYVVTAPAGPGEGLKQHVFSRKRGARRDVADADEDPQGGRITYMGKDCSGVNSGGITVEGGTMAEFRRTLEPDLDRVLVDETGLRGSYDFKIGLYANQTQLFELMHAALGLVVTPEQRVMTVLTVRAAEPEMPATLQAKL